MTFRPAADQAVATRQAWQDACHKIHKSLVANMGETSEVKEATWSVSLRACLLVWGVARRPHEAKPMWTDADRETCRDRSGRNPSDLTDAQWATVVRSLAGDDPLTANLREMLAACLDMGQTGCPWRSLPTEFGPWDTMRTWHDRFRSDGLRSQIAALPTRAVRRKRGRPAEPTTAILEARRFPGLVLWPIRHREAEGLVADGLTFHGLRHRTATMMRQLGYDMRTIAEMLSRKTEGMAAHDAREADFEPKLRGVVKRLDLESRRGTKLV